MLFLLACAGVVVAAGVVVVLAAARVVLMLLVSLLVLLLLEWLLSSLWFRDVCFYLLVLVALLLWSSDCLHGFGVSGVWDL